VAQVSRTLEAFLWLWAAALLLFFSALRHKEPRYVGDTTVGWLISP
jgi:hypothetical protein